MFGFLFRNDRARLERAKKRVKSPRAAVFAEFALLSPLLVVLLSGMIELASFWDSEVMANHTAWQIGRQATVHGKDLTISKKVKEWAEKGIASDSSSKIIQTLVSGINPALKNAANFDNYGNLTAMFMMSTCSMGYYGGTPGSQTKDLIEKILTEPITKLFDELGNNIDSLSQSIADAIAGIVIPGGGDAILRPVLEQISKLLSSILQNVLKPLVNLFGTKLISFIKDVTQKLAKAIDAAMSGKSMATRRFRQLFSAASRIAQEKDIVTVTEMVDAKSTQYSYATFSKVTGRLDFPKVVAKGASSDGFLVKDFTGWPPNDQAIGMYKVTVSWPFSKGWVFPVISGFGSADSSYRKNGLRAVGMSLAFPKLDIDNKNLSSTGAVAYAEGDYTNTVDTALEGLRKEMDGYIKLVSAALSYRTRTEEISITSGSIEASHGLRGHKYLHPYSDLGYPSGEYNRTFTVWNQGDDDQYTKMKTLEKRGVMEKSWYQRADVKYLYWRGAYRDRYVWMGKGFYSMTRMALSTTSPSPWEKGNGPWLREESCNDLAKIRTWPYFYNDTSLDVKDSELKSHNIEREAFDATVKKWPLNVKTYARARFGETVAGQLEAGEKKMFEDLQKSVDNGDKLEKMLKLYAEDLRSIAKGDIKDAEQSIGSEGEAVVPTDAQEDPAKFAENAKKRWEKVKTKEVELYYQIDAAIGAYHAARANALSKWEILCVNRKNKLNQFKDHYLIALRDMVLVPEDEDAFFEMIRKVCWSSQDRTEAKDLLDPVSNAESAVARLIDCMNTCFRLETEYCKMFGSRNAGRVKEGASLDDLDYKKEKEKIDEEGGGTLAPGDDPGMEQDTWHLTTEGWR